MLVVGTYTSASRHTDKVPRYIGVAAVNLGSNLQVNVTNCCFTLLSRIEHILLWRTIGVAPQTELGDREDNTAVIVSH